MMRMKTVHRPYIKFNKDKNCYDWAIEIHYSKVETYHADTKEEIINLYEKLKEEE